MAGRMKTYAKTSTAKSKGAVPMPAMFKKKIGAKKKPMKKGKMEY